MSKKTERSTAVRHIVKMARKYYPESIYMQKQFARKRLALVDSGRFVLNPDSPVQALKPTVLTGEH